MMAIGVCHSSCEHHPYSQHEFDFTTYILVHGNNLQMMLFSDDFVRNVAVVYDYFDNVNASLV